MIDFIMEKNQKYHFGLIVYIFCFLFAPPIIPNVNFIFVVFTYSVVMILLRYKKELLICFKLREVIKLLKILIIYIIVYILSILINSIMTGEFLWNNYIINIYSIILAFPVTLICSLYIIFRSEELNLKFDDVIKLFIWAGIIQAGIAIITLIFPSIKRLCINIMYYTTGEKLLKVPWITSRRFYGFAHSMLDLYGFGTGILSILPIYYGLKKDKRYIFLAPMLLLVPFLNSRSGLVIFGLGLLMLLIFYIKRLKPKDTIKYISITIFAIIIICLIINWFSPNTIDWILKDFQSFLFTSEEDKGATANVLFSKDFWQLPPLKNILIGTGHNISAYSSFAVEDIAHSDVGYINELWKTGIIGSYMLYYFIYYMLKRAIKRSKTKEKKLLFCFFEISIFVFLIKASIFTYNPGTAIIYTLALLNIYQTKKRKIRI